MLNHLLFLLLFRFRATLYQCPETAAERQNMANAVNNRIADLQTVLRTTEEHSHTQLQEIAQEIDIWQQKVTININYNVHVHVQHCLHVHVLCVFVFYKSYLIFFFFNFFCNIYYLNNFNKFTIINFYTLFFCFSLPFSSSLSLFSRLLK